MDLVTGALGSVLKKLAQLLHDEYKLQKGVRKKIITLERDLESMHAALRKVGEVPPDELDEAAKLWARDVRELSFKAEDILDTFLVRVQGHKNPKKKWYKLAANSILEVFSKTRARHQIAGLIEIINEKAKEVEIRRGRYRADDIVAKPAPKNAVDPRLKLMYKEVGQLVGVDKSSCHLLSMLSSSAQQDDDLSNKKLKTVSIVGFGGLGKTTLAKVVYDELKPQYACGAFVSVGRNPVLADVLKKIIFGLSKENYESIRQIESLDLLRDELRNVLRNKRYLIVIDDIWDIESWETIDSAFLEDNNGSRIITTTRKAEVAPGAVYKLQPLSLDNSKRLFYTRLFGGEEKCPGNDLDDLSNKILKKCGGVPLAIITMSSLLMGKSREQWFEVCSSPGFYRDKDDRHMDNTTKILSLSYYDLPSHLKTCLLYLSVFPEDYDIDKESLIWKWIAEGFVEKKPASGLFEVGEEYYHDLINRSMIQEVELDDCNDIVSYYFGAYKCRVHDMVLDLICSKSREENFVSDQGTLSETRARRYVQRNRALGFNAHQDIINAELPLVRSFIVWGCVIDMWTIHPRFELLRVLALEHCRFRGGRNGLQCLGNLLHLRYLGIVDIYGIIGELPEEIGDLKFLCILDVNSTNIIKLPSSVGKLTQLVCLRACGTCAPDGIIRKLTSLEELHINPCDNIEYRRQFWKDLGNLHELRVLKTGRLDGMDEGMMTDLVQSLSNLQKMQNLNMREDSSDRDMNNKAWDAALLSRHLRHLFLQGIEFSRLPACISPSRLLSLSHLFIVVRDMDEQGLEILGRLPELCYLMLETWSTATLTANNTAANGGFFQKLRYLMLTESFVHFVANEDGSSVSFTAISESGMNDVAFIGGTGAKKKGDCCSRVILAPAIMMPNLQELHFRVQIHELTHNKGTCSCDNLGLHHLPSLQKVKVRIFCWDAFDDELEREEAALRHAIQTHRNQPMLQLHYFGKADIKRRSAAGDDDDTANDDASKPWGSDEEKASPVE